MAGLLTGRPLIRKPLFWSLSILRAMFSTAAPKRRELQHLETTMMTARRNFRRFLKKSLGKSNNHAY
jgi:hypothetical protein